MGDQNLCGGLPIVSIEADKPLEHMYKLQLELQSRLNKIPLSSDCMIERVAPIIYWRHCIHSECDELLEWYYKGEFDFTEVEMEAIDILHFVFNIGISLSLTTEEIGLWCNPFYFTERGSKQTIDILRERICFLSSAITDLIDLLPWKTWKNYENYKPDYSRITASYSNIVRMNLMLCSSLNMSLDRVLDVYCAKNLENHRRQNDNY